MKVEVLDSVTLQRLQALELPQSTFVNRPALAFSPDSRILTCFDSLGDELSIVSWDLQTGGVASTISQKGPADCIRETPSITYLADGKMVGVRCRNPADGSSILIFNVASGVYMHSHSTTPSIIHAYKIWTHGKYLRFVTFGTKTITIWEVGLTSDAIPTEVETLPAPGGVDLRRLYIIMDEDRTGECIQFLPAPCRLALNLQGNVMVWDPQNSKYLLHCTDTQFKKWMSFSSEGRFFACSAVGEGVYLWKESATGYVLHQILASKATISRPFLSRNGESIVVFGSTTIRLWRTKGHTTPPSSVFTRALQHVEAFLQDFSPDRMLAAVARQRDRMVTIINLKSNVLQLTIDAGMEVYGLRMTGNTIAVTGSQKFVTWDLPTGDCVPGAEMTLEDSARTVEFTGLVFGGTIGASISPDSRHIALVVPAFAGTTVQLRDGSTGEELTWRMTEHNTPFFAPDGRDLWLVGYGGCGEEVGVGDGGQFLRDPRRKVDIEDPPEGYPWASSHGYRVTNDWWILSPDGKRLLMVPPPWQSAMAVHRVWKGQFLALLHGELPEPVMLELNQ